MFRKHGFAWFRVCSVSIGESALKPSGNIGAACVETLGKHRGNVLNPSGNVGEACVETLGKHKGKER